MPVDEIELLKQTFIDQLSSVSIYLFGSYAEGKATVGSDSDFYIVVNAKGQDIPALTAKAYRAIRRLKSALWIL